MTNFCTPAERVNKMGAKMAPKTTETGGEKPLTFGEVYRRDLEDAWDPERWGTGKGDGTITVVNADEGDPRLSGPVAAQARKVARERRWKDRKEYPTRRADRRVWSINRMLMNEWNNRFKGP